MKTIKNILKWCYFPFWLVGHVVIFISLIVLGIGRLIALERRKGVDTIKRAFGWR